MAEAGDSTARSGGVVGSLKGLLDTLLGSAQTRLQLLGNEFQEEALRLRRLAFYAFAAVFFLGLAVVFGTLFVIMVFWETHGVAVIAFFAVIYAILGGGLFAWLCRLSGAPSRLFHASVAELGKDREQLKL